MYKLKKAIRVGADNADAITAQLAKTNGRCKAHTYSTAQVLELLPWCEDMIAGTVGPRKADHVGACLYAISDRYYGKCTGVVISRKPAGWFIVRMDLYPYPPSGKGFRLWLTKKQAIRARLLAREAMQLKEDETLPIKRYAKGLKFDAQMPKYSIMRDGDVDYWKEGGDDREHRRKVERDARDKERRASARAAKCAVPDF